MLAVLLLADAVLINLIADKWAQVLSHHNKRGKSHACSFKSSSYDDALPSGHSACLVSLRRTSANILRRGPMGMPSSTRC
jgi:hypothetical protein